MHEIRSHSQSSKVVRLNPILIKNFRPTRSHVFWRCRSALQSPATIPEKESWDMQLSNLPCPSRRNYSWYAIAVVSSYSNYSNWIMWRLCMWCSAPCAYIIEGARSCSREECFSDDNRGFHTNTPGGACRGKVYRFLVERRSEGSTSEIGSMRYRGVRRVFWKKGSATFITYIRFIEAGAA